ncbi:ATP-binding protein [Pseudomonas fulva]|uniref:ATP-binding protein n=1 Tax=Pseudomonas fulva TaxID=47880 RepID=UPI000674A146|nr:ATP-binding protein [Pseudomonas fulva]
MALISYDDLYQKMRYPVPMAALRKAMLNAVVHKDYARAVAVQISAYPAKLMIWNPGQLSDNWTLGKHIAKYASCPFSPDIADTFSRAGLIKSWGRGIERIIEACRQDNHPLPQWEIEPGGLWVTFRYAEAHIHGVSEQGVSIAGANESVSLGVNVGVKELLEFITANQPVNASAIAVRYLQVTQRVIGRRLKKLCEQGGIEFQSAPKTGGYFVKEH